MKATNNPTAVMHKAAKIIAMLTNPAVLSIIMLLIISFTKSDRLSAAAAQAGVLLGLFVILPLVFVVLRTASRPERKIYRADPTLFLKQHPLDIIVLGIVCGSSSWTIMKLLSAPASTLCTLIALQVVSILIAIINLFYRASFHMAAVTVLVYMAVVIWGDPLLILLLVIPPIAWAKYTLHEHDFLQMILGASMAVAVTAMTIRLL